MSHSLNRVQLIGNVGSAPEIRTTSTGGRFATLRLATNRSWTDPQGQKHEETEWHSLVFWGKLADVVENYVARGDRLYVEGSLHHFEGKHDDGTPSYRTEIRVRELIMLGSPRAPAADADRGSEP